MTVQLKTIFIKKVINANVSLFVQDIEGILPARWFYLNQATPRVGIPLNYALSYFIDHTFKAMVDNNYIEIENIAALVKQAEDLGYIAPSPEEKATIVAPKVTDEIILAVLKGGNVEKMTELFRSNNKERAFAIAQKRVKELTKDSLDKIENILGVALTDE